MANIVICADGTWNRPEEDSEKDFPTNVLKLARAIKPSTNGIKQHVFYDWGLGSYHSNFSAGATGRGIHKNILDGYRYIVQNYAANDKIYLYGFSRGAYTVRALSGLINNCGILKRADARLISEAWKIYKSPQSKNHPDGEAAKQFRNNYCHASRKIHFIGVWDTVGALGIPFSLMGLLESHDEFYDTKMGSNVSIARQALAIDEQREDFQPTIWTPRAGVDLKQVWFSGVHADVGGSYPPDKKTHAMASDVPLSWMLDESTSAGLKVEPHIRDALTSSGTSAASLAKLHKSRNHVYRLKKPAHRALKVEGKPTKIHQSVKARYLADSRYRPKCLKEMVEVFGWDSINVED
jgi:uncharacterized protein (DUF2235 family)